VVGEAVERLEADFDDDRYWLKRRRYAPVPKGDMAIEYTGGHESPMAAERESMLKPMPVLSVGEAR
jgi:hypothetical protein